MGHPRFYGLLDEMKRMITDMSRMLDSIGIPK
jgi:hypothetical protein